MAKSLAFLIVVPFGLLSFYSIFVSFSSSFNLNLFQYFFLGGMVFSIFIISKYEKKFEFYSTFEHELTHNLWAMIFLKKPTGFRVNEDGTGLFQWTGASKFSSIFIYLAPYFFPTACFLWLPFYVMCKEEYYWFYFLMMGIFFGYHLMSTYQEIGTHQSDITANGIIYSYILITCLFVVFHGIILTHLIGGFKEVINFLFYNNLNLFKSF